MHKIDLKKTTVAVMRMAVAIALTQLPLWLLRPYAALPQPLFELDLLLALAIFAMNRWIGVLAILAAWSLTLLRAVAVNYYFHNVAEFVDTFRFADLLSYSAFLTLTNALLAVLALLIVAGVLSGLVWLRPRAPAVMAFAVFVGIADMLNGSATAIGLGRDMPFVNTNVLGSAGYNLVRSERDFLRAEGQPLLVLKPPPRSFAALRTAAEAGQMGVVLLLVESLGLPQSPELRSWLLDRLQSPSLRDKWDVDVGAEEFAGGTVAGELRVLCGLRGHYSRLADGRAEGCLPYVFRAHGIASTAMHGFSPRMFDRTNWWPKLGFEQLRFGDDWANQGAARCPGAFNGICDHDVLASAFGLASRPAQFAYALTINTHLPLPPGAMPEDLHELCRRYQVPDPACQLIRAQGQVLSDIAVQLSKAPESLSEVVVVGDHSPPFNDFRDRHVFNQTQVPSLILRRRHLE